MKSFLGRVRAMISLCLAAGIIVAMAPLSRADTTTPCVSANYQPDASIEALRGSIGQYGYAGYGVCNVTGKEQTRRGVISLGEIATFSVRVSRAGTLDDSYLVQGRDSHQGFVVHYFLVEGSSTQDITASVVAGSYQTDVLTLPDQTVYFRVRIRALAGATPWSRVGFPLLFTSAGDSTKQDLVRAVVSV